MGPQNRRGLKGGVPCGADRVEQGVCGVVRHGLGGVPSARGDVFLQGVPVVLDARFAHTAGCVRPACVGGNNININNTNK